MKRRLFPMLLLILALLLPQSVFAWNHTGHKVVARIAWERMTPTARQNVIGLLQRAPKDACFPALTPGTETSEPDQRAFFMTASTWPDIVRPQEEDTRSCTRFHHGNWHFINFFWEGISGETTADRPQNREDIEIPEVNIVERLKLFRPFVACETISRCGPPLEERATTLAWMLHLVGDIHQPLHTSARVTSRQDERSGDRGGNQFKLGTSNNPPSLHGFWDGILDRVIEQSSNEPDMSYLERVAATIMKDHPPNSMDGRLRSGDFDAWAREGFETTKRAVYPRTLQRGQMPGKSYRDRAFAISEEAIALGGYRLADLLNKMFGS